MYPFPVGKIPHSILSRLFTRIPVKDPRVLLGPEVGEDAAVIDIGDHYLVAKADPITFATERIGWYTVHVNANDVACMGARPRWMLVTLLLPEGNTDLTLLETIFEDLLSACSQLDITLCGGHSEVTYGLNRPILVGQLLGEVDKEKFVQKDRITPGDVILLTKGIAIEGTSVIARELGSTFSGKVSLNVVERAKAFLTDPGISVVKEALAAVSCGRIHGMHDPTEGGLVTGLWELAKRAKVGMLIYGDSIPVLHETRLLCDFLGADPMGLLASGALLVVVDSGDSGAVQEAIQKEGIFCTAIGEIRDMTFGVQLERGGTLMTLYPFEVDELARIFGEHYGCRRNNNYKKKITGNDDTHEY